MLLKNHHALVTGAGSGIGRAVAEAYAREGAHVILLGRNQERLEETYDAILADNGNASIVPLDLENDLGRVPDLAERIQKRFGRLEILVNCAGDLGVLTPLGSYEPATWEKVFRINVTAPFFLTQSLLPLLLTGEHGSVINVSSSVAHKGRAYWGAYAASKAALVNLTETWSEELQKRSVRLNTVNPGGTATTMRGKAFPGEDPKTLPTPEAIVPVFLYLASTRSLDVRGQHLNAREWMNWKPHEEQTP